MISPRGYCVGRYPFERGGFPATPLAVIQAPALSICDPVRSSKFRASVGKAGPAPPSPASPTQAPRPAAVPLSARLASDSFLTVNDRPASPPSAMWRVTAE